jgi:CubicO group peptidase (beta-lactamase class C family)
MRIDRIVCIVIFGAIVANPVTAQSKTKAGMVAPAPASGSLLSDAEIRDLLKDRIDVQHKSVGMVVGIVTPQGRRIVSYGQLNQRDPRPLDGDTVFEIGSVTKIFTALLLADMVQRGEVVLTDPVGKYLPPRVKVPERNGQKITLVDLATQTSGLPFFPTDIPLDDPAAVVRLVANYSVGQLYQFLSSYELPRDIGSKWEYSNTGFGLLGIALANRAGTTYEDLVRARITGPLEMTNTAIAVSPQMKKKLAAGHDSHLQPAPEIDMPAFVAAGSLRSSANDLLTFLAAFVGARKSPLAPAMAAMLQTRRPGPGWVQTLGWWIVSTGPGDDGFATHGGETPGYTCTVAYDPKTQIGVVALSNSAENDGGLAWHLLRPNFPLTRSDAEKAAVEGKEISVDSKLLDRYVGHYKVEKGPTAGEVITIERTDTALVLKSANSPQGGTLLHAKSEKDFFMVEIDLKVSFETDGQGPATGLVFHFAGSDTPAKRIDPGQKNQ